MSNPGRAVSRAIHPVVEFVNRNVVDPVSRAIERAVTPPDNGATATASAIQSQTEALQQANEIAIQANKDANARVAAVSVSPADSESARRAAEDRIRRITQSSGFTSGTQTFGAGPIGYRTLSGQ